MRRISVSLAGVSFVMELGNSFATATIRRLYEAQVAGATESGAQLRVEKFLALLRTAQAASLLQHMKLDYEVVNRRENKIPSIYDGHDWLRILPDLPNCLASSR